LKSDKVSTNCTYDEVCYMWLKLYRGSGNQPQVQALYWTQEIEFNC